MTARPHPNQQVFARLSALENKMNTEINLLHANVEQYRLLCENRHLHTQRIAEMEKENNRLKQELKTNKMKYNNLEKEFMDLKKRHEEMKGQMETGDIDSNSKELIMLTQTGPHHFSMRKVALDSSSTSSSRHEMCQNTGGGGTDMERQKQKLLWGWDDDEDSLSSI